MHFRTALLWRDTVVHESSHWRTLRVGDRRGPPLDDPHLIPGDALVTVHGDRTVLHVPRDLRATVNGEPTDGDIALSLGDTATIAMRDAMLVVQPFVPEHRLMRGGAKLEGGFLGALLLALTAHLAALIAAFLFFEEAPQLSQIEMIDRVVEIHSFIKPVEPEPPPAEELVTEDPGRAAKDDEGVFGQKDETRKTKLAKREGTPVERAREAGALRALGDRRLGGALKSVFGDRTGFSDKLNAGVSGLEGEMVMGHGQGLGTKGTDRGGGGIHTYGMGGARGVLGDGRGRRARSRLQDKRPQRKAPTVTTRKGTFTAFCKAKDIQRVVVARRRGVQHCYEKALRGNPEMSGKITMVWRIGANGDATGVRADSNKLGSAEVAACMRRVIDRWKFPPPEGGVCQVRYPFVFNSGL